MKQLSWIRRVNQHGGLRHSSGVRLRDPGYGLARGDVDVDEHQLRASQPLAAKPNGWIYACHERLGINALIEHQQHSAAILLMFCTTTSASAALLRMCQRTTEVKLGHVARNDVC